MAWVGLEKFKILIGKFLHLFGELPVMKPKFR